MTLHRSPRMATDEELQQEIDYIKTMLSVDRMTELLSRVERRRLLLKAEHLDIERERRDLHEFVRYVIRTDNRTFGHDADRKKALADLAHEARALVSRNEVC